MIWHDPIQRILPPLKVLIGIMDISATDAKIDVITMQGLNLEIMAGLLVSIFLTDSVDVISSNMHSCDGKTMQSL